MSATPAHRDIAYPIDPERIGERLVALERRANRLAQMLAIITAALVAENIKTWAGLSGIEGFAVYAVAFAGAYLLVNWMVEKAG